MFDLRFKDVVRRVRAIMPPHLTHLIELVGSLIDRQTANVLLGTLGTSPPSLSLLLRKKRG